LLLNDNEPCLSRVIFYWTMPKQFANLIRAEGILNTQKPIEHHITNRITKPSAGSRYADPFSFKTRFRVCELTG
jgi:hypothetical protein